MMPHKLGLIAGGGGLPCKIIDHCKSTKRPFLVIAIKNQTNPDIVLPDIPHKWFRLGAAGSVIRYLKVNHVKDLVMAGTMTRPSLAALRPDLYAIQFFAKTGASLLGDNGLLSNLTRVLSEEEGFNVIGPDQLLPELIARKGALGSFIPTQKDKVDILTGIKAALELGRKDIGQAVIARNGKIIGFEDKRGTDHLLKKIIPPKNKVPNGVLVKIAKPEQETRADLPTIGPQTIINVQNAGLSGIAIQSGLSLILDQKETIQLANNNRLFIFGVKT